MANVNLNSPVEVPHACGNCGSTAFDLIVRLEGPPGKQKTAPKIKGRRYVCANCGTELPKNTGRVKFNC